MSHLIKSVLWSLRLSLLAHAATVSQWRGRSIYQIMTDRFALSDGSTTEPCSVQRSSYCGGSWQGIIAKLDYIQDMGFDAVWISPITRNIEGDTPFGQAYHGYWQADLYTLNPHFGSPDDLKALSHALHSRNMYLMVDVVVNHNAWSGPPETVNYSRFIPFDQPEYYHTTHCSIDYGNMGDVKQLTQCWVGDETVSLPDLRTEDERVRTMYSKWVSDLIRKYSIDGLRIDTVLQVEKGFWSGFVAAVPDTYMIGEVFDGDAESVCDYGNYLPGLLNYPVYLALADAFRDSSDGFPDLATAIEDIGEACQNTSLLGTFSENHDNPRFAAGKDDVALAKNLITFTMLAGGIPIIYQGQEQFFRDTGGSGVPYNRAALWTSEYNSSHELYILTARLNHVRRALSNDTGTFSSTFSKVVMAVEHTIAFNRAGLLFVLSNKGSSSATYVASVKIHYGFGATLTDLLTCEQLSVRNGSEIDVKITHGSPRVFHSNASFVDWCG